MLSYRLLLCTAFIFLTITSTAQTLYTVTHTSGTQTIGGNNVTVTATTNPTTWVGVYCSLAANTYWIGSTAQGFKYQFSTPVNVIRFRQAAQNTGEIISFYINGVHYPISTSEVTQYTGCIAPGSQIVVNGNLEVSGTHGNGQVDIRSNVPIDSFRVHHQTMNLGGVVYDFQFGSDSMIYVSEPFYDTVYCPGDSIHVPYTVFNKFNPNNVFSLELSDNTGSFANPLVIGTYAYDTSGTIHGRIPLTAAAGGAYRVRISSSSVVRISRANDFNIKIKPLPALNIFSNSPRCETQTLNINATAAPGTAFNWTGPSYTSTQQNVAITNVQFSNAGNYFVTANLNGCIAKDTIPVVVKTMPVTPSVSNNSPLCEEATLNLTAQSTTPGVGYIWSGPLAVPQTQNPTINSATTGHDGTYTVSASLNGCTSPATSTTVVVKPKPAKPTSSNNGPICGGGILNLTTSSITPGVIYNWTGPDNFTSTLQNPVIDPASPKNAGPYSVSASLNGCTSNADTTIAVVNVVSYLGAYASPNDTICEGTPLTVVTVPTNGGTSPQFQWYKNNVEIPGATKLTYSITAAVTGDSFYCRMIANGICNTTVTLFSNKIGITVLAKTPAPEVNITSNPASPLPGNAVTFTANVINGGASPYYQWLRNGAEIVGATANTWTASNLLPYDNISVRVTTSDPCPDTSNDTSNTISINFPTAVNTAAANPMDLKLYPNPNGGRFTIEGDILTHGLATIEVVNMLGQAILREKSETSTGAISITLPPTAAGTYLLKINTTSKNAQLYFSVY